MNGGKGIWYYSPKGYPRRQGSAHKGFYPTTRPLGSKTAFSKTFDTVSPTVTVYEVFDRAMQVTFPDNTETETKTEYSTDAGSNTIRTLVTDALGGKQATYTDGSGKLVKPEQLSRNVLQQRLFKAN